MRAQPRSATGTCAKAGVRRGGCGPHCARRRAARRARAHHACDTWCRLHVAKCLSSGVSRAKVQAMANLTQSGAGGRFQPLECPRIPLRFRGRMHSHDALHICRAASAFAASPRILRLVHNITARCKGVDMTGVRPVTSTVCSASAVSAGGSCVRRRGTPCNSTHTAAGCAMPQPAACWHAATC